MNKRILIVDDDQSILEVLSTLLEYCGYDVNTLSKGDQVFETIADFHPNLILLDVMLGEMDGRKICSNIKEKETIPVILISASHQLSSIVKKPGGPDDFLAKPFEMDSLLQKIEMQLAA
jgi:DNA-binding response OmpR family regulator